MAQDLHGRKTRLEDDAEIYTAREQKSGRETFRSLHGTAKREYFFDYYFPRLAAFALAAALVIFLIVHLAAPRKTYDLYVAVLNAELTGQQKSELMAELEESLAESVMIDDGLRLDENGMEKLQVYLANGQIDLILAPPKTYRTLSAYGLLVNLEEVLGQDHAKEYQHLFMNAAGYLDDDNLGFYDSETGRGARLPYGMRLPDDCSLNFVNITDQVEDYGAEALGGLLTENGDTETGGTGMESGNTDPDFNSTELESGGPETEDGGPADNTQARNNVPPQRKEMDFILSIAQNSKHVESAEKAIPVILKE